MPVTRTSTSSTIWYNWCEATTTATTVSTASTWVIWNTFGNGTSATGTATTWQTWNTDATMVTRKTVPYVARKPTAEEVAVEAARIEAFRERQEAEAKRWAAEQAERDRKKKEADDRAYKLLTENLTPQQLADFNEFGCFNVVSLKGNNYRIRKGSVGNLDALDASGKVVKRLCVHPQGGVPFGDIMLSQKLLLEAGEEDMLLKKANLHGFSQPTEPVPLIRKVA
jgi:hypothetical protein